jgi:hypothetical protein
MVHNSQRRPSFMATVGKALLVAFWVLAPMLALGLWLGWIDFDANSSHSNWNFGVSIDHQKIQQDVNQWGSETDEFSHY